MVFTNKDLKRLKKCLEEGPAPTYWSQNDSQKILALLYRLEVAEHIIANEQRGEPYAPGLHEAWFKACGL